MTQYNARPTTYQGIKMRSRLEAGYAAWLDQWRFDWEYEPRAFASRDGQYLPDFVCHDVTCTWLPAPVDVYIEVKPASWPPAGDDGAFDLDEHSRLMQSMGVILDSEPGAQLLLAQPKNDTAEDKDGYRWVRTAVIDQDPILEQPWPTVAFWCKCPGGTLGLTKLLTENERPWPPNYWRVGG